MRMSHLGPHSFLSQHPHPRHHEWLTRFTPRERHELFKEDYYARLTFCGIIFGAILFHLLMLLIVLPLAL